MAVQHKGVEELDLLCVLFCNLWPGGASVRRMGDFLLQLQVLKGKQEENQNYLYSLCLAGLSSAEQLKVSRCGVSGRPCCRAQPFPRLACSAHMQDTVLLPLDHTVDLNFLNFFPLS